MIDFRSFSDYADFKKLCLLLEENGVPFKTTDLQKAFDPSFAYVENQMRYRISLEQHDFEKANQLIKASVQIDFSQIPEDYYLLHFTDDELQDVLIRSQEWNEYDVQLAKLLLESKGISLENKFIRQGQEDFLNELHQPEKDETFLIVSGYIFTIMGGFFGFIVLMVILKSKKTLPDGTRIHNYSTNGRKHAHIMLYILAGYLILLFLLFGVSL